jgi:hypothetical protein
MIKLRAILIHAQRSMNENMFHKIGETIFYFGKTNVYQINPEKKHEVVDGTLVTRLVNIRTSINFH